MSQRSDASVGRSGSLNDRAMLVALLLWLVPFLLFADTGSFRFAWLSDTHVGSPTGEEDLRVAVRDINSMTGLSFVVLSGHVTEYGSVERFRPPNNIPHGLKV